MAKGQVVVQKDGKEGAFPYQRSRSERKKSFYPLPYSEGSLVLLCAHLFGEGWGDRVSWLFLLLPEALIRLKF